MVANFFSASIQPSEVLSLWHRVDSLGKKTEGTTERKAAQMQSVTGLGKRNAVGEGSSLSIALGPSEGGTEHCSSCSGMPRPLCQLSRCW